MKKLFDCSIAPRRSVAIIQKNYGRSVIVRMVKAVLFFSLLCMVSPVRAQMNAEQLTAIGRNVMMMDDYMLAIQYFNSAIKAKPDVYDPWYFRALAKYQLEDLRGAEDDCTKAIGIHEYKVDAYKLRGFIRHLMGRDSLAVADYNHGLYLKPLDRDFLYFKAIALTTLDSLAQAELTFDTLLTNYNQYAEGFTARAFLNLQKTDTIAAIADIDRSLSLSSNLINAYLLRAEINSKQHHWQQASDDMDQAIRLNPQNTDYYVNRAFVRYNNEDYFGAMADYNYAIELDNIKESALFNRALLRYEVRDLKNSIADLSRVIEINPDNVHAIYNRGLIYLQTEEYDKALTDFDKIIELFPRFYPVYYAKAEALQNLGNTRAAFENYYFAEDLIKRYVEDPEENPLDKPAIAAGDSNERGSEYDEDESQIDVMNRFNRLVTENTAAEPVMSFDQKIRGRVQDRKINVEPEPMYVITLFDSPNSLRTYSNYFRELDRLNSGAYIPETLYLSNLPTSNLADSQISTLFSLLEKYDGLISSGSDLPIHFLIRGIINLSLKNYQAAIADLTAAMSYDENFTVAYMARAAAYQLASQFFADPDLEDQQLLLQSRQNYTNMALADFDKALTLNPRLVYAWYNKGNIYYDRHDYTSALECYTKALQIDPSFGEALYNRALVYLQSGNKASALSDLSRAGELGVIPAYRLLKEMR